MGSDKKGEKKAVNNGANLGFEQTLWQAADKLRGNMDGEDYKNVVLGLIFLKYISDTFQERHSELNQETHANPEDRDEHTAENVFWVPKATRWDRLQASAKQTTIASCRMSRSRYKSLPLFRKILTNTKESSILADIRDILLPKRISGEIRVNRCDSIRGGSQWPYFTSTNSTIDAPSS